MASSKIINMFLFLQWSEVILVWAILQLTNHLFVLLFLLLKKL